jgi:uncharacterized membrane protein YphA (DoxX/SURF4 family)
MRRLHSTFAHGSAGLGLLVLRLAAGIALIVLGIQGLLDQPSLEAILVHAVSIAIGLLLSLGLCTQCTGVFLVADALCHVYAYGPSFRWILLAAIGAAIALLGPGAWSIDARRFGWKRVELKNGNGHEPPAS